MILRNASPSMDLNSRVEDVAHRLRNECLYFRDLLHRKIFPVSMMLPTFRSVRHALVDFSGALQDKQTASVQANADATYRTVGRLDPAGSRYGACTCMLSLEKEDTL